MTSLSANRRIALDSQRGAGRNAGFILLMRSPEVFYLHIRGEQRGPYTVAHIDHLLNSGLVDESVLFWREGLEQWEPVTNLVQLRRPRNRLKWAVILICAVLMVVGVSSVFGPITLDGWREIYQHEFTQSGAYWRARDVVRTYCVPKGSFVVFDGVERAEVQLIESKSALVVLHGLLSPSTGGARATAWTVRLNYDPTQREWIPVGAAELPPK